MLKYTVHKPQISRPAQKIFSIISSYLLWVSLIQSFWSYRAQPIDNVHNSVTPSLMKFLRIPPFFKVIFFRRTHFCSTFFLSHNEIINLGVP